jgi:ribosome maturation factor RimP
MGAGSIEERVQAIAERVAIDHGLELVHAEVAGPDNKPIVRIFIDKPVGVTHEDCSEVSFHLGTILDVEDFIHSSYTLEVSSPDLREVFTSAQITSVSPAAWRGCEPAGQLMDNVISVANFWE